MKEHICPKCQQNFETKWKLTKHLERLYPCDAGKHQCQKCLKKFAHLSNLSAHRKTCKGREMSSSEKDEKIQNLETVLAATGNQRPSTSTDTASGPSTSNSIIHHGSGDIINGDQINNIQNNTSIFVLPLGNEDISHIQKLSIQDLQSRIGLQSDPSTMIKLFELIRTDENHPENHTMLLPDLHGHTVHCKREDGWKTETFNNGMHRALHSDNSFLIRKLPDDFGDKSFQDGYIMNEIQQKINFCDHDALMEIYNGIRVPLHDLTMRLAKQHYDKVAGPAGVLGENVIPRTEDISDLNVERELMDIEKRLLEIRKKEILMDRELKMKTRMS